MKDETTVINYWCSGATDTEIAKWTEYDRAQILGLLTKVAAANDLLSHNDLRDYDPDDLIDGYQRNLEESAGKFDNSRDCQSREERYGNSYRKLEMASKEFLRLLEKHHGIGSMA